MFTSSKKKSYQSNSEKGSMTSINASRSPSSPRNNIQFDDNQVTLLTKWLTQLNREQLINITDQNDIVIMAGGKDDKTQQIFITCDDIDNYMNTNSIIRRSNDKLELISMSDIAKILLKFRYVYETSGQLSFKAHNLVLGTDELKWLTSIVRDVRPLRDSDETRVTLFDGENTEVFSIPAEHMPLTNNKNSVANYLYRNGHVRYDIDTGVYAYRYVPPDNLSDENVKSPERIYEHQFLSSHIRTIHVDQINKRVELEFQNEPNNYLVLPNHWYRQLYEHQFNKDYIIDTLLANGGVINTNTFAFMGRTYSIQGNKINRSNSPIIPSLNMRTISLPLKEKNSLICQYVDFIIQMDGVKKDRINDLIALQNYTDGHQLYFTPEHSLFIQKNRYKREDVIYILLHNCQIKQDQFNKCFLYYNNQYIPLPSSLIYTQDGSVPRNIEQILPSNKKSESFERYHSIIDYMYRHGLVTWDKSSKLIKLHFTDQTLLLPMDHLRSIIDSRIASSSYTDNTVLPFTSRQLSEWLINNSYITHKKH